MPSAQGHAIISTEISIVIAIGKCNPAMKYQKAKDRTEIKITTGTKYEETESASFCIGAREAIASCTIFTICERVVASPTFVALIFNNPLLFIVAPITSSPIFLLTGIDSPVIMDWSTEE